MVLQETFERLEIAENIETFDKLETETIHEAQRRSSLSAASLNQGSIKSHIKYPYKKLNNHFDEELKIFFLFLLSPCYPF